MHLQPMDIVRRNRVFSKASNLDTDISVQDRLPPIQQYSKIDLGLSSLQLVEDLADVVITPTDDAAIIG